MASESVCGFSIPHQYTGRGEHTLILFGEECFVSLSVKDGMSSIQAFMQYFNRHPQAQYCSVCRTLVRLINDTINMAAIHELYLSNRVRESKWKISVFLCSKECGESIVDATKKSLPSIEWLPGLAETAYMRGLEIKRDLILFSSTNGQDLSRTPSPGEMDENGTVHI